MTFRQASIQSEAFTLSGHYYTAPEIFYQETQRIFYNHWLCVGRSEQIPEPGDYFLTQVGEENLIVLRDSQSKARAFFNVCRHRGTRLCRQAQGHLVEAIRCPYHGWTYSLEGELRSGRREGVPTEDNPLFACALYEWEGWLWVNLAPNPAPFTQTFAPLLNQFTPWRLADLRIGGQITYDVQANWKLIFQNYFDRYNLNAAGRSTPLSEGAFLAACQRLDRSVDELTDPFRRSPLPGVQSEHRQTNYYSLFPTMLLSLHPDYAVAHRLYPQTADRTRVVCEWLFDRATADRPDACADAIELWDFRNRQAWYACEHVQQRKLHCAQSRGALTAFDREYLRVLGDRPINGYCRT